MRAAQASLSPMGQAASMGFGDLLRDWRHRRRMSQLDLALTAEISQRHLSFVESGRSQPSRDMVLRLAEHLDVPARERNTLLVAAGFAPLHRERPLDDPAMKAARDIANKVEQEMTYPGEIQVTLLREVRCIEYAK